MAWEEGETCLTCKYYCAFCIEPTTRGRCKRTSPIPIGSEWPPVDETDWCWEWKAIEEE